MDNTTIPEEYYTQDSGTEWSSGFGKFMTIIFPIIYICN